MAVATIPEDINETRKRTEDYRDGSTDTQLLDCLYRPFSRVPGFLYVLGRPHSH